MLKVLIFTTLIFALVFSEDYPYYYQEGVISLAAPIWGDSIAWLPDGLLIYYYEPACTPCRKFWPEYTKAAKSLADSKSRVKLAKVNCYEEYELCGNLGIKSFPTLYLHKGQMMRYIGPKKAEDIEIWIKKLVDAEYPVVNNGDDLYKRASLTLLINTPSPVAQEIYMEYNENIDIAKGGEGLDDRENYITTETGIKEKIPGSVEELRKRVDDLVFNEKSALPNFGDWHWRQLQQVDEAHYFVLYFRTSKFNSQSESASGFQQVAKSPGDENKDFQFVYANVNDDFGATLATYFRITDDSDPVVGIIAKKQGVALKKYKLTSDQEPINAAKIRDFLARYQQKNLQNYIMSAEKSVLKDGLLELTGNDYQGFVTNSTQNVFLMLYYPWCDECVKLELAWKSLAYKFRNMEDLVIARLDVSRNDVEGWEFLVYPAFIYYGNKEEEKPVEYMSERTMKGFTKYLNTRKKEYKIDL